MAGFVGDSNRWRGRVVRAGGGTVEVEADGGVLRGLAGGREAVALAAGDPVDIFVRPGAISLLAAQEAAGGGEQNMLRGSVESLLFNGADSRALVRTEQGQLIQVGLPQSGAMSDLRAGANVGLVWEPRQTTCFRAAA